MSIVQAIVQPIVQAVATAIVGGDGGVNPDMVLVMATTGAAETITIPCQNVGTFNATINWGDGSADSVITAWNDADLAHVYAVAGDQTITISGTFPNIYFNNGGDKLKLKEVTNLGATGLVSLSRTFNGCTNLTSVSGYSELGAVTTMLQTFDTCTSLVSVSASDWDVSSVESLSNTFFGCTSLTTINVSKWDVSKVTTILQVFVNCTSLATIDVSNWATSLITNIAGAFRSTAVTDLAIDGWDISSVSVADLFLLNLTLPTSRYDATLIAWDAQNVQPNLSVHFGSSKYTDPSAAATARANLVATDLWTITDGGPA